MRTPSNAFLALFILVTLLEIVGDEFGIVVLHYGLKPLIMILLMAWTWQERAHWLGSRTVLWLLIGMVWAWLGDVLLMIRGVDLFGPGLGAFLIMQLCYVQAFRLERKASGQGFLGQRLLARALPFVLFATSFLVYLYGPFHQTPGTRGLWIPVIVYVVCLCSMAVMAAMRREAVDASNYVRVLLGATLFVLSDSVIALGRFAFPFTGSSFVVMSTYAAAQYLIVTGVLIHATRRQPVLESTIQ